MSPVEIAYARVVAAQGRLDDLRSPYRDRAPLVSDLQHAQAELAKAKAALDRARAEDAA